MSVVTVVKGLIRFPCLGSAPGRPDARSRTAGEGERQLFRRLTNTAGSSSSAAFREERLIEQDVAPVREQRLVRLLLQSLHNRVIRVDLQDRLAGGQPLARLAEDPLEVAAHAMLVGDEAGR